MKIDAGYRLGPYEMNSRLGAGGMGEVWRATDTRLDRSVAIKILPPELAENAQFRMRFEREAKAISHLNHPNICTLHDVGVEGGVHYLVMELLHGESLADRLAKGPLPLGEALRHGIEIASALDRAHREGIIHRDLKPGNVMLTKSGAKLLDFGLAKSATSAALTDATAGTTQEQLTQEGMIVGTFQYMSPEQVSGEPVDARSDIFAFGAVLYEMVTGARAFGGRNRASVIAAILSNDPRPVASLQPLTPPALERLIQTCLAKDPDDRWQTTHDVMRELKWIEEGGSEAGVAAPVAHRRKLRERAVLAVAVIATVAAAILAAGYVGAIRAPARVTRTSIAIPPDVDLFLNGHYTGGVTISPDGRYITFPAVGEDGKRILWLRPLDGDPHPIPDTSNAIYPFWSPDSRFIAFFADGKLKKMDIKGAPPLVICNAETVRGGSWSSEGTILFSPNGVGPISKVAAAGGVPVQVTKLEGAESTHRSATFLPDGRHFLYMAATEKGGKEEKDTIYVASIDAPGRKFLLSAGSNAVYASGYLLYARDRTVVAQPFDLKKLELRGDPVPIAQSALYDFNVYRSVFSTSVEGTLVYARVLSEIKRVIRIYDRAGKELEQVGEPDDYNEIAVSPDAKQLALTIVDGATGTNNIWLLDIQRNLRTRFTFGTTDRYGPLWSPDGSFIVFTTGNHELCRKRIDGSGGEEVLWKDANPKWATGFSPDGKSLLFNSFAPGGTDVWLLPLTSGAKPYPLLHTAADERNAQFSPDGRWITYASNESGHFEVYVAPFLSLSGKWQVSQAGAMFPLWSSDGKEIVCFTQENRSIAIPVAIRGNSITFGPPAPLLSGRFKDVGDMTRDHTRFVQASTKQGNTTLEVITNWPATIAK